MKVQGIQETEFTRADAIRKWQDAKEDVALLQKANRDLIERCNHLADELGKKNHQLADETEQRKAADGRVGTVTTKLEAANSVIEQFKSQLQQRRDCTAENKRLDLRIKGLSKHNEELKAKVATLQKHDFKADLENLRIELGAAQVAREKDLLQFQKSDRERAFTISEQAEEINKLTKANKELTEKLERLEARYKEKSSDTTPEVSP